VYEKLLNERLESLRSLVKPKDWNSVERALALGTDFLYKTLAESNEPEIKIGSREELEKSSRLAVINAFIDLAKEKRLEASSPEGLVERALDLFVRKWIDIVIGIRGRDERLPN
jgi:hypothetical protein